LVIESGERGAWVTATVRKDKATHFLQYLSEHDITPQSSRLLIPELEHMLDEKRLRMGV